MYDLIKPEWFRRRKYSGWGITPITWQGWLTIIVLIAPIAYFASKIKGGTPLISAAVVFFIGYFIAFMFFIFGLMSRIKIDERNRSHEALADRNALWALVMIIGIGLVMEGVLPEWVHAFSQVNPFIVGGIVVAWLVKVISMYWLDRHD
jgi:purine-cytosine permease-like protein